MKKKILCISILSSLVLCTGCGKTTEPVQYVNRIETNEEDDTPVIMYGTNEEDPEDYYIEDSDVDNDGEDNTCGGGYDSETLESMCLNLVYEPISGRFTGDGKFYTIIAKDDSSAYVERYVLSSEAGDPYIVMDISDLDSVSEENIYIDNTLVTAFDMDAYCEIYGYDSKDVVKAINEHLFYSEYAHLKQKSGEKECLVNKMSNLSAIMKAVLEALHKEYSSYDIEKWMYLVDDASGSEEILTVSCLATENDNIELFGISLYDPYIVIDKEDNVSVDYSKYDIFRLSNAGSIKEGVTPDYKLINVITFDGSETIEEEPTDEETDDIVELESEDSAEEETDLVGEPEI